VVLPTINIFYTGLFSSHCRLESDESKPSRWLRTVIEATAADRLSISCRILSLTNWEKTALPVCRYYLLWKCILRSANCKLRTYIL